MASDQAQRQAKPFEPEGQFILRLPAPAAELVRMALSGSKDLLKDRLQIDMQPDKRDAKVYVDSLEFSAKLMDLPCIIETHKTLDRKTFYKTGDICQILVASDELNPEPTSEESKKSMDEQEKNKQYQWKHGITPPLKNVRKSRFRKTLKRKDAELQEIENELKRLLRADSEAVNVRWDIIHEEDNKDLNRSMSELDLEILGDGEGSRRRNVAEHDIFGEELSSSEEEDDNMQMNDDMMEENDRALDFFDSH